MSTWHITLFWALLVSISTAQEQPGQVLLAGTAAHGAQTGGLWLTDPTAKTITPLANLTGDLTRIYSLEPDPYAPDRFLAGTFGATLNGTCTILEVVLSGGRAVRSRPLVPQALPEDYILSLVVVGDEIFYLGRKSIGRLPRLGGPVKTFYPFPPGYGGHAMASDGRYLFVAITATQVVRFDIYNATNVGHFFTTSGGVLDVINGMAMDHKGNLLIATACPWTGGSLFRVDAETGTQVQRLSLVPMLAAHGVCADPATDTVQVTGTFVGGTQGVMTLTNMLGPGSWYGNLPVPLSSVCIRRTRPLMRWAVTCATSLGKELAIGAKGLPRRGNGQYCLVLNTAMTRQHSALVLIGRHASRTFPLPLSLESFGAPGCHIHVEPLLIMPIASQGPRLYHPLPIPQARYFSGVALDSQWLLFDPGANPGGVVTSQVGSLVIE